MDWEMKARCLAEDLMAAAVGWLSACVWLMFVVDGWLIVLPVIGALGALGVLRDARIEP